MDLRQNLLNDVAVNIGQAKVAAGIAERQLLMIKTKAMQHRGVQIMHTRWVFDRFESYVVRSTVRGTALDTAASQPHAETPVIVIAPGLRFSVT